MPANSSRFHRYLATWVMAAGVLMGAITGTRAAVSLEEYQQTQQLTAALGRVLRSHQSTLALLGLCAKNYPHLADSAGLARAHLRQANQPFVDKAHAIQQRLAASIARQQTTFDAEKFSLEIDIAVQNSVSQFRQTLAGYNRQEQHYVCNRLVLSVRAGEWDIPAREPEASQVIRDFE